MQSPLLEPFQVAAVQDSPVFLDREASVDKACQRIAEAGANGARLVVFPEGFLPAYPFWAWHIAAGDTQALRPLYAELLDQAITVPSPATDRLGAAARAAGTSVAIGINERNARDSGATLYNSLLWIANDGRIVACHRKLVPTGGERLVHAPGDGSTLAVHDLPCGRAGGLICWENYMPLARYTLYALGIQIYVAPTWDRGEPWISTLRHIAKEGRVYVLGCCSAMRKDDVPDRLAFKAKYLAGGDDWINPGDSAIVDPDGKFVAGPLRHEQTILYAEVDPRQFLGPRGQLDVAGHYGRPDVFELTVHRREKPMVRIVEEPAETAGSEVRSMGSSGG